MSKDLIPKGYANTAYGQVHYRRLATVRDSVGCIVLIHWLPLSSRMYAAVMPALAERGYETIAIDLLGYGRSDPRPTTWSMTDWADSVAATLQALGIRKSVSVLGGHSGACVAVELALRHPVLIEKVMLDGCPFLTPELAATFAAMGQARRPAPLADGSHESLVFRTVRTTFEHYLPGFAVTPQSIEYLWPAMIDYLETDFVSSAPISAAYDLAKTLPAVRQPALLLGARTDTLAVHFARARELLPAAAQHFFPADHPLHELSRVVEYATVLANFLDGTSAQAGTV
ncbi:MAG: alpha/beta fold hydrolase [Gammaproteobacteria bacterium]|jgi:pimeloyl-ACP methyl ester carboxylesterase